MPSSLPSSVVWVALIAGALLLVFGFYLQYRRALRSAQLQAATNAQRRRFKIVVLGAGLVAVGTVLGAFAYIKGFFRFHISDLGLALFWMTLLGINVAIYMRLKHDQRIPAGFWLRPFGGLAFFAIVAGSLSYSLPWQVAASAAVAYFLLIQFSNRRVKRDLGQRASGNEPKV